MPFWVACDGLIGLEMLPSSSGPQPRASCPALRPHLSSYPLMVDEFCRSPGSVSLDRKVLLLEVTPSTQRWWAVALELLLIPVSVTTAPAVAGSHDAAGPDLSMFNRVIWSSSCSCLLFPCQQVTAAE